MEMLLVIVPVGAGIISPRESRTCTKMRYVMPKTSETMPVSTAIALERSNDMGDSSCREQRLGSERLSFELWLTEASPLGH